jgi:hypothetical protein
MPSSEELQAAVEGCLAPGESIKQTYTQDATRFFAVTEQRFIYLFSGASGNDHTVEAHPLDNLSSVRVNRNAGEEPDEVEVGIGLVTLLASFPIFARVAIFSGLPESASFFLSAGVFVLGALILAYALDTESGELSIKLVSSNDRTKHSLPIDAEPLANALLKACG